MNSQLVVQEHPREQVLAELPVTERRLELAGISTAVLEGLGTGQTGAEINARSTHGSETVASADLSGVVGGA